MSKVKYNFNAKRSPSKDKKKLDKMLKGLSEAEKKEMLGSLLHVANTQTIMNVVQPSVEVGYDDAFIYLYENFVEGLDDDNKEEKILNMLSHIISKYEKAKVKRMEFEAQQINANNIGENEDGTK